jgi:hypothetical protein
MGESKRRAGTAPTQCPVHPSIARIEAPARIRRLNVDHRGFPVPWFVAWIDGVADHRIIDAGKMEPAIRHRLCWTCGEPLGQTYAFTIGPMCAVNRVISEPPSHRECAEYAVAACPFLSRPEAHRRTAGMPDAVLTLAAGDGLKRNPGVICLWVTRSYKPFRVPTSSHANRGILFDLGEPIETVWYAEGRHASHMEVVSSLYSGLSALIERARADGRQAEDALAAMVSAALPLLPGP